MLSKERLITYSIIFILLSTLIYFVFLGDERYVEDYNIKIEQNDNVKAREYFEKVISICGNRYFKSRNCKIRPRNWSTR